MSVEELSQMLILLKYFPVSTKSFLSCLVLAEGMGMCVGMGVGVGVWIWVCEWAWVCVCVWD